MSPVLRMSMSPARIRASLFAIAGLALFGTAAVPAAAAATAASGNGLWVGPPVPTQACPRYKQSAELGVKFSPKVDGQVTSLGYYRTPSNVGSHIGRIYDEAGRQLASATYNGETATGWQYVRLANPVSLKQGVSYFVSYTSPTGCHALTPAYLNAKREGVNLTVPVNGGIKRVAGGTIVATDGSSYWPDVTFVPNAAPVTPANPTAQEKRSKYSWPFAANSIWNMPIGSGAQYLPLGLTPPSVGYGTDEVYLPLSGTAPLRELVDRGYWWPWVDGTAVKGKGSGVSVRVPDSWVVSPPGSGEYPNRAAAALQGDGKVREFQYIVRPQPGSPISFSGGLRATYDLTGDGLTGPNGFGAHGGSGMTAIGGTIRPGELSSSEPIRHALAVTMNMRKWGTSQGGKVQNGYRWPAIAADNGYEARAFATGYGTLTASGKDGLGMGSLLALPASVDVNALRLETSQGAKLAWTYQNYGAYVVDDSADPGSFDVHRHNVEIGVLKEFPAIDTGFTTDTPFGRDMNKIFTRLAVVDNNSATSVGGGGTPRQPLAPAFSD